MLFFHFNVRGAVQDCNFLHRKIIMIITRIIPSLAEAIGMYQVTNIKEGNVRTVIEDLKEMLFNTCKN
jgi:hypothetical protein